MTTSRLGETLVPKGIWWCHKISSWTPCFSRWPKLDWSRFQCKPVIKLEKKWDTPVWCLPKILRCLSYKEKKMFRGELTWSGFWMNFYVYLLILLFLSFIVVHCLNEQWIPVFMFCWKNWFCILYKIHSEINKHRSTSFMRDNI